MTVGDPDDPADPPDPRLGVFDTLLVRDNRPVDLEAHLDRLTRSVHELYAVSVDVAALSTRVLAEADGVGTARVRTTYEPAAGRWRIDVARIDVPGLDPRAVTLRRSAEGLGRHKWTDRRMVADPGDADDVLLVDEQDRLLECGRANLFVVIADECRTPPLDGRILPGTVRARALARLRSDRRPVVERVVSVAELTSAAEVFTTSSIRGVQPVVRCAEVGSWPIGPVTTWLRNHLDDPAE